MVASHRRYQLLIADDDTGFRETLRDNFAPYFETLVARCGEEAVELSESHRVDIALLDMHMHVLSGLDTICILKSLHVIAPCILMTSDATEELRERAAAVEVWSVLAKPVRKQELVTTVSSALEFAYDDDWLPAPELD